MCVIEARQCHSYLFFLHSLALHNVVTTYVPFTDTTNLTVNQSYVLESSKQVRYAHFGLLVQTAVNVDFSLTKNIDMLLLLTASTTTTFFFRVMSNGSRCHGNYLTFICPRLKVLELIEAAKTWVANPFDFMSKQQVNNIR